MNEELIAALVATIKVQGLQAVQKDINAFAASLRKMAKAANDNLKNTEKTVQSFSQKVGAYMQQNAAAIRSTGRYLTVLGAALTGVVLKGGKEFLAFQRDAANTSTMLSGTVGQVAGQMAVYNDGIKQLSITYNQSTSTLQKGLYDILSASIDTSKAMYVLEVSAEAATAGLTTVAISADAITTILNSYQMAAEQAGLVSDKLWAIVRKGKITFEQVASGIGKVASIAAVAGLSFDELGAGIATATRAGVKSEEAMVGLNSIVLAYLKHTDEQTAVAKKFGIELSSTSLKAEGLIGMVKKLAGANEMNRKATAEEIVAIFANKRALKGLMPIIQNTAGFLRDVVFMQDAAGLSALAYSKISETLGHQLGQLGKQLNILMMDYFEPLAPMVSKVVGAIKSLIAGFDSLSPGIKAAIATITILSGVFFTLSGVLLMLAPGLSALGMMLSGPVVVGALAVVAALIGAGGLVAALSRVGIEVEKAEENMMVFNQRLEDMVVSHREAKESAENLIASYKKYKEILSLSKEGTNEHSVAQRNLNAVIKEIIKLVPDAANEWDEYGKALDVDIGKVEKFTESQERMYQINIKMAALEAQESALNLLKKKAAMDKDLADTKQHLNEVTAEWVSLGNKIAEIQAGMTEEARKQQTLWGGKFLENLQTQYSKLGEEMKGLLGIMAPLERQSLEYQSSVLALANSYMILYQSGAMTSKQLEYQFKLFPGLEKAYNDLVNEGVVPLDESLIDLVDTMDELRKKFPDFGSYLKSIEGADENTKSWKDEVSGLDKEIKKLEGSMEELFLSGENTDATYEKWTQSEHKLIKLREERTKVSKEGMEEEAEAIDKLVKDYETAMHDFQEFQGASTQTVLDEIDRRQNAYASDSEEWIAWEKVKLEYTRAAAAEITAIWGKMYGDMAGSVRDTMTDIFSGDYISTGDVSKQTNEILQEIDEIERSITAATEEEVTAATIAIADLQTQIEALKSSFADPNTPTWQEQLKLDELQVELNNLIDSMKIPTEAAVAAGEKQIQSLRDNIDELQSSYDKLGEGMADAMASGFSAAITKALNIDGLMKNLVDMMTEVGNYILGTIINVFKLLGEAAWAFVEQVGLGIAVIGNTLYNVGSLVVSVFTTAFDTIVGLADSLAGSLFTAIGGVFEAIGNVAIDAMSWAFEQIASLAETLGVAIADALGFAINAAVEGVEGLVTPAVETGATEGTEAASAVPGWIGAVVALMLAGKDGILNILDSVMTFLDDLGPLVKEIISVFVPELIKALPEIIAALVTGIAEGMYALLGTVTEWIADLFDWIWDEVAEGVVKFVNKIIQGSAGFVSKIIQGAVDFVSKIIQGAGNFVSRIIQGAINFVNMIISGAVNFVSEILQGAMGFTGEILQGAVDFTGEILQGAVDFVSEIVAGAGKFVEKLISELGGGIGDAGDSIVDFFSSGGGLWQEGTRWTGDGPINEPAGIVHRKEAVIPWSALKNGLAGIANFMGYTLPEAAQGMIVNGFTPLIAGEAGPEAIIPFDKLQFMISSLLRTPTSFNQAMPAVVSGMAPLSPYGGMVTPPESAERIIETHRGGDTYNFNFALPAGAIDDKEYWKRIMRDKGIPAIKEELSRVGKKLGG